MNNQLKHRRRSETQIRTLLNRREKMDIPVTAFCKAHKIHKATFYNWRNKFSSKIERHQGFVPVQFSDTNTEASLFAEIELSSNVTVKLFQKVDASYFKTLL